MKYILLVIFIGSAVICNAQTQRIKDLIPEGDINASQYPKAKEEQMRQSYTFVSEKILLQLNGESKIMYTSFVALQLIIPSKIICMDIISDEKKIADYTKDASIKKVVLIETKD